MKGKKTTRRALVMSLLSLLLCCSMLVGTTFAWFTDSVTSGRNKIVAGNLDVTLDYYDATSKTFKEVTSDVKLFDDNALWEPGHTEIAYLKVANAGTLALKYQLLVNVYAEQAGTNVYDKAFKLSDYLVFTVVEIEENEVGTFTRETARAEAGTELGLKAFTGEVKDLEPKKDGVQTNSDDYVMLVIYMPESVDNNANYKTGTTAPSIEMGVVLNATQFTYENDSFGKDYDENAAFSIWNGTVPAEMPASLVVDGTTQTIHVQDADAFAYLSTLSAKWAKLYTDGNGKDVPNYANGAGADYYYSNQWTISLDADIDLDNKALAPVDIRIGESTGATAFDGNGHTIRNINATTGLFADKTRASFANLTLVNVKATNGALIGSADHDISNVTVKNATISGDDYVGGLVGYAYAPITGCKVIDSSVVATGKEAGGLVGYVATSRESSSVASNTVRNVSVYANNRAAGLAAQVNVNIKVYNNKIDTVTVGAEDTRTYQCGAVVSNAIEPANVYNNTVVNANVLRKSLAIVSDATGLNTALADNKDIVMTQDVTVAAGETGSNGYGATGISVLNGQTIDGNGSKIGVNAWDTWDTAINTTGGTIKNITVNSGMRGIFVNHNSTYSEKVILENVIIDGTIYTISCDHGSGKGLEATGSTFNGWTSYAATIGNVKFTDCSFGEGNGYAFCRPYAPTEFVGCDFAAGYEMDPRAAVTFESCTIGGAPLTAENLATLVTSNIANASVK